MREDIGLHQFYLSLLLGHPVMVVNNDYRANLPRCPTQGEEVATTINSRFHKFSEFKIGVKHGTLKLWYLSKNSEILSNYLIFTVAFVT